MLLGGYGRSYCMSPLFSPDAEAGGNPGSVAGGGGSPAEGAAGGGGASQADALRFSSVLTDPNASPSARIEAAKGIWKLQGMSDADIQARVAELNQRQDDEEDEDEEEEVVRPKKRKPKRAAAKVVDDDEEDEVEDDGDETRRTADDARNLAVKVRGEAINSSMKNELSLATQNHDKLKVLLEGMKAVNPEKFSESSKGIREEVKAKAIQILTEMKNANGGRFDLEWIEGAVEKAATHVTGKYEGMFGNLRNLGRTPAATDPLAELADWAEKDITMPAYSPKKGMEGAEDAVAAFAGNSLKKMAALASGSGSGRA